MKKILTFLCICVLSVILLSSCKENIPIKESGTADTSNYETDNTATETKETFLSGGGIGWSASEYIERDSWDNIYMEIVDIDESGVRVRITDYDNVGFWFNPVYFVLEYNENGSWNKISLLSPKAESLDSLTAFPDDRDDFVRVHSICYFELMSVKELRPGKYRLTKVLSGGEVCCEFAINYTNKVPEKTTMVKR